MNDLFHLSPRVLMQPLSDNFKDCDLNRTEFRISWRTSSPSSSNLEHSGMYASNSSISGHVTFSIPVVIFTIYHTGEGSKVFQGEVNIIFH